MQLNLKNSLLNFVFELEKQKFNDPYTMKQLEDMLDDDNYDFVIIDNKGYIISLKTDVTELIRIAVKDEHEGWGSLLMKNLREGKVILEVNENNSGAINFYKKHGFKEISIRKNYYKDGANAIIMERE